MAQINLNYLLAQISSTEEVTMKVLAAEVTVARKPFVEADIKSARQVLDRLQDALSSSEVLNSSVMCKVVED